jgi:hypothetical protein
VHEPSPDKIYCQLNERGGNMKLIGLLMLLCLFGMCLSSRCGASGEDDYGISDYYASKDPTACKSIDIICPEKYGYNDKYADFRMLPVADVVGNPNKQDTASGMIRKCRG